MNKEKKKKGRLGIEIEIRSAERKISVSLTAIHVL